MNDLIKYNNLLHEQGMNSPEAAAILQAHTGDADFERRARFVRFAHEARGRQPKIKQRRRVQDWVIWALIILQCSIMAFAAYKAISLRVQPAADKALAR